MVEKLTDNPEDENADDGVVEELPVSRIVLDPASPSIRSIVRVVVIALLIIGVAISIQSIIASIASLVFLLILSIFFAYLMEPIVQIIRRPFEGTRIEKAMPRTLAIAIAYVIVFVVLGVAILNLAPIVGEQAREFGTNLPALGQSVRDRAREINTRLNRLKIPDGVQAELNRKASETAGEVTQTVGDSVVHAATYLPWLLLVPILAFFILKDVGLFRIGTLRMFPAGRWRYRAELVMQDLNSTLAAYTRAQLISCLIIGTICTTAFLLFGLKYAILLGILAGIFEFVPLLGPLTIGIISLLTVAASDEPWKAVYVGLFLVILRLVHDYYTYPRIIRGGMHLHPLAIILAVLAGEQVAGIPGVFISIPVVAAAAVFYRHVLEHQGRNRGIVSGLIEDAEAQAAAQAAISAQGAVPPVATPPTEAT